MSGWLIGCLKAFPSRSANGYGIGSHSSAPWTLSELRQPIGVAPRPRSARQCTSLSGYSESSPAFMRYTLQDEVDRKEVPRLRHVDVCAAPDICSAHLQPPYVLAVRARRRRLRKQNWAPRGTIRFMAKKTTTTAPEIESDLNLKHEAFCQYYTKNQHCSACHLLLR